MEADQADRLLIAVCLHLTVVSCLFTFDSAALVLARMPRVQ